MSESRIHLLIALVLGLGTGLLLGHELGRARGLPMDERMAPDAPAERGVPVATTSDVRGAVRSTGVSAASTVPPTGASGAERLAFDDALTVLALSDPAEAVARGLRDGADVETLAALFRRLVMVDAPAAYRAWALVPGNRARRRIALALFHGLGGDRGAYEALRAELPAGLPPSVFEADAIVQMIRRAPDEALALALDAPNPERRAQLVYRVGNAWGYEAPREALARRPRLGNPRLLQSFEMGVMDAWARVDPDAALAFVEAPGGPTGPGMRQALRGRIAMQQDAGEGGARVIEVFAAAPVGQREHLVSRLVGDDPDAAWAVLVEHAGATERADLAVEFGRTMPVESLEQALAWIDAHPEDRDELHAGLVRQLGDIDDALAVFARIEGSEARGNALRFLVRTGVQAGRSREMAELVLEESPSRVGGLPAHLLASAWGAQDLDDAVDWLLDQRGEVARVFARGLGEHLAQLGDNDLDAVLRRAPAPLRRSIASQVVSQRGARDPQGSIALLRRHDLLDGDNASAAIGLFSRLSREDPVAAAEQLRRIDLPAVERAVASVIAMNWAQADPRAALRWTESLSDIARRSAESSVVMQWSGQDDSGAREWVLDQPRGADRDALLGALLAGSFDADAPDARLMGAFSGDDARVGALTAVLPVLMARSPDAATAVLERWVDDPALRRSMTERALRASSAFQ